MKGLARLAVLFTMTAIGVSAQTNQNNNSNNNNVSKNVLAVQTLYNYLIYPNSQQVFPASGVSPVDALFSPVGVQGRIAPLGEGHDLMTVKKTFFGVKISQSSPDQAYVSLTGVTFRSITDLSPVVLVVVDLSFTPGVNAFLVSPFQVRETGQFTFNKAGQIVSFDLQIPYYDFVFFNILGIELSNPNVVTTVINQVCAVATSAPCSGMNAQYNGSFSTCAAYLSTISVGSFNRLSANSLTCRLTNLQFVQIDPANDRTNSCPVLGQTGGNQCVYTPYSTYFTETF